MSDQVDFQGPGDWARRYLPSKRLMRKKFLTPLVLAGLGVLLFLLALREYPSAPARLSTPVVTHVTVTGPPLVQLQYRVHQVQPTIAAMKFIIWREPIPPADAHVEVALPPGATFVHCRIPCVRSWGFEFWDRTVKFRSHERADLTFLVRSRNFNLASNGVNASVAIPDIDYRISSPHPKSYIAPAFIAEYGLSSPNSYDWSTLPPTAISDSKSSIAWDNPLTIGDNAGRDAVGIKYDRQTSNNSKTFIAGALLGLAGAAILVAVQELMHATDDVAPDRDDISRDGTTDRPSSHAPSQVRST